MTMKKIFKSPIHCLLYNKGFVYDIILANTAVVSQLPVKNGRFVVFFIFIFCVDILQLPF